MHHPKEYLYLLALLSSNGNQGSLVCRELSVSIYSGGVVCSMNQMSWYGSSEGFDKVSIHKSYSHCLCELDSNRARSKSKQQKGMPHSFWVRLHSMWEVKMRGLKFAQTIWKPSANPKDILCWKSNTKNRYSLSKVDQMILFFVSVMMISLQLSCCGKSQ